MSLITPSSIDSAIPVTSTMPASKCVSCNMSIGLMVVSLAYVVISVGVTMCVAIQLIVGIIVPASMSVVVFAISLIIECDGSCLIRCQCFDFSD